MNALEVLRGFILIHLRRRVSVICKVVDCIPTMRSKEAQVQIIRYGQIVTNSID